MDDLRVIEEVQRHGILYDTAHPFYKDNVRKEQAWSDVSLALGADAADCKSRWRMLRDSFVKHVKKISVSNGPPGYALRDWKYATNMAFLQPFIQNRATKRRRLVSPEPEGDRLATPSLLNPSPCPALPAAPSPVPLWAAPLEEDRPHSVTDGDRDEMYHFALSTVPQLLRLGKRHRRRAKMEILQTLSRLEEEEEEQAAARRFLQPAGTEATRTGVQIFPVAVQAESPQPSVRPDAVVKEEPEETLAAVCVTIEDPSVLQREQTEHRQDTPGEDLSSEPEGQSSDTDNDDDWGQL